MDAKIKRFSDLLQREQLPHQTDAGRVLIGADATVEFNDDCIWGTIERGDFMHVWEIYPTDFRQAVKKIREFA
jgi:hypothetical protein